MEPSKACYAIIKKWEGYHTKLSNGNCKAYLCPAGVATIGYGTTRYPDGIKVRMGDERTQEEAEQYLSFEVVKICVPAINKNVKVPLTQGQFDALISFIYNFGEGAFAGSTLLALLNNKDYMGAAKQFPRWNKANGEVWEGLVSRRKEEMDLFLTGVVTEPQYPVLMRGDMGNPVLNMQEMLIKLTYTGVEADGVFGAMTEDAVKRFQNNMKLTVDGICGPATWKILISRTSSVPPPEGNPWLGLEGNYAVATRLFKRDGYNMELIKVEVYKAGASIGHVVCVSGQNYAQTFRKSKESYAGSMEPAPELKKGYTIHNIQWANGTDNFNGAVHSAGLGPWIVWLEQDPSDCRRSEICFHQDWNRSSSPGSAGCICTTSTADSKTLISLLRSADPKKLFVDWGLGYVEKAL